MAVPVEGTGTASVEHVMAPLVPGVQGRKTVLGPLRRWREGEETSRFENKTRLDAAELPGSEHGSLQQLGVCGRAGLEAADVDDLVPGPDSDGEGAGSVAHNGAGAIVERLKGWNDAAMMDPDEGGGEELGWQLDTRIVARQRRNRGIQSF